MASRLSSQAENDLVEISRRGVLEFGVARAKHYHDALFDAFERLADHPRIARERKDLDPPVRIHPFHAHIVVYTIEDDDILILRVRHGRENWSNDPEATS